MFVIINADDFGWTEGINEGILEAHRHGVLTSATLLTGMKATNHAIELAKSYPRLSVGVHLSYGLGEPLVSVSELNALYKSDGKPKFKTAGLWFHASIRRKVRRQLDLHFRSQVEYVANQGLEITHLDTHKHLHYSPVIFEIVARIASDFKIPAVRLIKENIADHGSWEVKTRASIAMLYWTAYVNMYKTAKHGLVCTNRFIGLTQTGKWTKQIFMDIIRTIRPGVTEIMMHPGHIDGLEDEPTRLIDSRQTELNILTYPTIKEHFYQCQMNMKLIGYRDLPKVR